VHTDVAATRAAGMWPADCAGAHVWWCKTRSPTHSARSVSVVRPSLEPARRTDITVVQTTEIAAPLARTGVAFGPACRAVGQRFHPYQEAFPPLRPALIAPSAICCDL
jgi:hypothetical protein